MSLLLSGVMRLRSLVLMLLLVLVTGTTMFLGVPSASATEGVTVTPGEAQCSLLLRTVTNNSSQTISVSIYEIKNGLRIDYPSPWNLAPGESMFFNTDGHYYTQSLGIKTGSYVFRQDSTAPAFEWVDWGAADWILPSGCPPMIAPATLTNRTKAVSKKVRPQIWFKAKAYATEFGYKVGNKGIKWDRSTWYNAGVNSSFGPLMKPGQTVTLKLYYRNIDDSEKRTPAVFIGKKRVTRAR